jgi:flagellar basal-body rod protein FlgB
MIDQILFQGGHLEPLKKALGAFAERGRVHARNVANAETPGYRAQELRFEESLNRALRMRRDDGLRRTNPQHLPAEGALPETRVEFRRPAEAVLSNGINDVAIEQEMADIAANTLRYTAAAEMTRRTYQGLRKAIHGRFIG